MKKNVAAEEVGGLGRLIDVIVVGVGAENSDDRPPGDHLDDWCEVVRRIDDETVSIAIDIDPRKLTWAKDFGATHTINASEIDPVEAVRALSNGNGVDLVIDAVGSAATYQQALSARDLAGTVVLVGVPNPNERVELSLIDLFGQGGSLKSSWYGDCLPSRDFPALVDLYLQGRLPLDSFISEEISLGDVEEAFTKMQRGDVLRSVVLL